MDLEFDSAGIPAGRDRSGVAGGRPRAVDRQWAPRDRAIRHTFPGASGRASLHHPATARVKSARHSEALAQPARLSRGRRCLPEASPSRSMPSAIRTSKALAEKTSRPSGACFAVRCETLSVRAGPAVSAARRPNGVATARTEGRPPGTPPVPAGPTGQLAPVADRGVLSQPSGPSRRPDLYQAVSVVSPGTSPHLKGAT